MNRAMKDSGIEWIKDMPEEWETRKIKNCYTVVSGATPLSGVPEYWDGDISWITPSDYKTDDIYITKTKRKIST